MFKCFFNLLSVTTKYTNCFTSDIEKKWSQQKYNYFMKINWTILQCVTRSFHGERCTSRSCGVNMSGQQPDDWADGMSCSRTADTRHVASATMQEHMPGHVPRSSRPLSNLNRMKLRPLWQTVTTNQRTSSTNVKEQFEIQITEHEVLKLQ